MNRFLSLINKSHRFKLRKYSSENLNVKEQLKKLELSTTYRQTEKKKYDIGTKFLTVTQQNRDEFLTIYPRMVDSILANPELKEFDDFSTRIADMLDYLVQSRLNRGSLTCFAYKEITNMNPTRIYTEEDYDMCKITGWAMEMAEAYTVILDDLVDLSSERRSMPCWHRFKEHGILTTYDCFYVKLLAHQIMRQFCEKHPAFTRIIDIINMVNYQVQLGQIVTLSKDMSSYNVEFYKKIVHHKTGFFIYYQPVILGVLAAYEDDEELIKEITDVTVDMALMYQIQNDVMDSYGPYSTTGKKSNDIQQGTCTWLISTALGLANNKQKKILYNNYGRESADAEKRVLDVYAEINVQGVYKRHKQAHYDEFKERIETGSSRMPKETLLYCLKHASIFFHDGTEIDTIFEYV